MPMQGTASTSVQTQSLCDKAPASVTGPSDCKQDGDDDSDSEVRRVPEAPGKGGGAVSSAARPQSSSVKRKRAGPSADKENKRLKRLLRNRVSAQQARERKKAYLTELEEKFKEMEQKNAELEERVSTLQRENFMLRQIVKNTTMNKNGASAMSSGSEYT